MKQVTFRLTGADRVSFIIFDYQDKETRHGILNCNDDDAKFIRSFTRRGFLKHMGKTWKFTRLGNVILRKVKKEFK